MPTLSRLRRVISSVPKGKVITYGQVAAAGGIPGGARVTVRALQSGEGIPWHRVVGAGGRIALSGDGGREQRLRLILEGVTFRGARVRMERHNWIPNPRGLTTRRSGIQPPMYQNRGGPPIRGRRDRGETSAKWEPFPRRNEVDPGWPRPRRKP
ncbi:MAG: MGMT family protein [Thermoplasmata archaeon]